MLTPMTKILLKTKKINIFQNKFYVDQLYIFIIFCQLLFCHTGRRGDIYGDKADTTNRESQANADTG